MVACRPAAVLVSSVDFVLWYALEKGQVKHFPFLYGQTGEAFRKQGIADNDFTKRHGTHTQYVPCLFVLVREIPPFLHKGLDWFCYLLL